MRIKDKVAIITGGGSGIGRAASILFAQEGAKVVVADFNEDSGNETVGLIKAEGGTAFYQKVDVSDPVAVDEMVQSVVSCFETVDILINNAGITQDATMIKMTAEQWKRVIDINLTGVFYCTQTVVPHMIANGKGKIINTSSVSGIYGNFGQTNYAAAKAGVIGMTKTWAKELGPKGINVNAVAPGFIETPMTGKMPEKVLDMMEERVPLKRLGKPEDVAKAYLFLVSEDADYINGVTLHVDGGLVL